MDDRIKYTTPKAVPGLRSDTVLFPKVTASDIARFQADHTADQVSPLTNAPKTLGELTLWCAELDLRLAQVERVLTIDLPGFHLTPDGAFRFKD